MSTGCGFTATGRLDCTSLIQTLSTVVTSVYLVASADSSRLQLSIHDVIVKCPVRLRSPLDSRFNPLARRGNYSATLNNMNLAWPLMGGLLRFVQRGWTGWGHSPPRPLLPVPNVTAHPSTAVYRSPYCCIMVRCSAVLMCLRSAVDS